MEASRKWRNIFQVLKEKNCQARILHSWKLSFSSEGENKTFLEERKLKEFVVSQSTLKKHWNKLLRQEGENKRRNLGISVRKKKNKQKKKIGLYFLTS